jgi:hypothetical protein
MSRSGSIRGLSLAGAALAALLAAAILALVPGTGRAQEPQEPSFAEVTLEKARAKYAAASTLHATFEGSVVPLRNIGERRRLEGWIAWRAQDASRQEIVLLDRGLRLVDISEGGKRRHYEVVGGKVETSIPRPFEGAVPLPLLPAFDNYDLETIALRSFRNEAGHPTLVEIEARFQRPIEGFTGARLGIEDRTWLIRTLDLVDAAGNEGMSVRFLEVKIDAPLPEDIFSRAPEPL